MNDSIEYKELLFQLLHEIRQINHIIKSSSEIISRSISSNRIDKQNLEYHSNQIFENSYLVSLWLDIVDFEISPDFFSTQRLESRSIYGKFKKATLSFRRIAKSKKIKICLEGKFTMLMDFYPIIDILPYIILDNAVKYSPPSSAIYIEFFKTHDSIVISVSSMGPLVKEVEIEHLFDKGFRAKSAIELNIQGGGRGLALVKHICEIHDATIDVEVGDNIVKYGNVEYANFTLSITFPL